jgi:hypothetical protein
MLDIDNIDGFHGSFNKGYDCDSCVNQHYVGDKFVCACQFEGNECNFELDDSVL